MNYELHQLRFKTRGEIFNEYGQEFLDSLDWMEILFGKLLIDFPVTANEGEVLIKTGEGLMVIPQEVLTPVEDEGSLELVADERAWRKLCLEMAVNIKLTQIAHAQEGFTDLSDVVTNAEMFYSFISAEKS